MLNNINSQDLENMGETKLHSCTWYYYHHDQESRSRNRCSKKVSILSSNLHQTPSGGQFCSSGSWHQLDIQWRRWRPIFMNPTLWLLRHLLIRIAELRRVWALQGQTRDLCPHPQNNVNALGWFLLETTLILSVASRNSRARWHSQHCTVCPAHSHSQQAPCASLKRFKWKRKPLASRGSPASEGSRNAEQGWTPRGEHGACRWGPRRVSLGTTGGSAACCGTKHSVLIPVQNWQTKPPTVSGNGKLLSKPG